jgi:hypothetical protein
MAVYVDELQRWPTGIRCFKSGSCHLTADTLEELHSFAKRLGLKREWFQPHRILDHYDLTPRRREKALMLGAVFKPCRQQIAERRSVFGEIQQ